MTWSEPERPSLRHWLTKLLVLSVAVAAAIALVRLGLYPLLVSLFELEGSTATAMRRWLVALAVPLSYWAVVHWYERRPVSELEARPWPVALAAFAGAASIGVTLGALYLTGHYVLVAHRGSAAALGIGGMIVVIVLIEEVFFRAVLLRVLEEQLGTWIAVAAVSAVFGVLHLANAGGRPLTAFSVTLLGAMWSGVFVLTRNLWAVTAHHAAWNLTIFVSGLPLSGNEEWRSAAPFESFAVGADLLTGGSFGPEDSILSIAASGLCAVAIFWLALEHRRVVPRRERAS